MNTLHIPSEERRQHVRHAFSKEASFQHAEGAATGILTDISFFGALLEMDGNHALVIKSGILIVPFGRDPEEAIRVHARVVYRRDRSVGLSWDALTPDDIIKVRRLAEMGEGGRWLLMRPAHTLFWIRRLP